LETTAYTGSKTPTRKRGRRLPASSLKSTGGPFDRIGILTTFSNNQKIFSKGEPAEYLYKVESGCIRTYRILNDGRRRICAFYFPGDYFGLEAREDHSLSADAITTSSVRIINRKTLASRSARDIVVVKCLLNITAMELQRAQSLNLLLLKDAQERIVDFLLDMKSRKQSQSEVDLPMPRSDIADYLGLAIETVSRMFTRLRSASAISLPNLRSVILRDLSVLN
jgi:CRP/FNR family transcriptional regulator, nitrogen fixation regulation protein